MFQCEYKNAIEILRQAFKCCLYVCLEMSNVNMEATNILPILKKKLAFLSGKTHTHDLWANMSTCVFVFEDRVISVYMQFGQ